MEGVGLTQILAIGFFAILLILSSFYSPVKDALAWIWRQGKRVISWFKKRGFIKEGWNPVLKDINDSIEIVLPKDVLDEPPDVKIEGGKEGPSMRMFPGKAIFYVSDEEIERKQLANDSFVNVSRGIVVGRSRRFRFLLPEDLRTATDDYIIDNVVQAMRPEAGDETEHVVQVNSDFDSETFSDYEKLAQMHVSDKLSEFILHTVERHADDEVPFRTRSQVRQEFERAFVDLQKSFRGYLIKVSKSSLEFYEKGLRGLLIPKKMVSPDKYVDWHVFLWVYNMGIVMHGSIEGVFTNSIDVIWDLYRDPYFQVEGYTADEVFKQVCDWARGLGAISGKVSYPPTRGGPLRVNVVLLRDLKRLDTEIGKREYRDLTNSRLTNLARLTQEQVSTLLERGL